MVKSRNDGVALVCTGGGAIGAYQVGVIKFLYENFASDTDGGPFSLFSGISAGSLNTSFLATNSDIANGNVSLLESMWKDFHVPQYYQDLGRALAKAILGRVKAGRKRPERPWSLFDPKHMYEVIERGFSYDRLQRCFDRGSTQGLAVAATELVKSIPVWFSDGPKATEWNAFHSIGIKCPISKDHISASCSIPVILPPVAIGSNYFVDGGVRMVKPLAAAVAMGAKKIVLIRTNVTPHPELPRLESAFRPDLRQVLGGMINALIYDHSYTELEQLKSEVKLHHNPGDWKISFDSVFPNVCELEPAESNTQVDIFSIFPLKTPKEIFDEFLKHHDFKNITARHELMFHRDFVSALIEYGYEDCKNRLPALRRFFGFEVFGTNSGTQKAG